MIAYASRTGTKRNLALLRRDGWRLMVSATGVLRDEGFPHALDNGAWTAFQNGQPFDEVAFMVAYDKFGRTADFFVLPDIVAGGMASLEFSMRWRERLGAPLCLPLLAVQDGMLPEEIAPMVGPSLGIFVGGSTEWKLATMEAWGRIAKARKAYLHIGRVNSVKRIALCISVNANSFDGTSASRFALSQPKLNLARHQPDLFACF